MPISCTSGLSPTRPIQPMCAPRRAGPYINLRCSSRRIPISAGRGACVHGTDAQIPCAGDEGPPSWRANVDERLGSIMTKKIAPAVAFIAHGDSGPMAYLTNLPNSVPEGRVARAQQRPADAQVRLAMLATAPQVAVFPSGRPAKLYPRAAPNPVSSRVQRFRQPHPV
jgi:hypothetical protein